MARTKGHGNPNWTRDETILALDLYFRLGGAVPSPSSPAIVELSDVLRSMPYHAEAARQPSFRNPDGVGFKLMNLRQVATGRGLGNVSSMDRQIWSEFGADPAEVARLAAAIRSGIDSFAATVPDREEELPEGRLLTMIHMRRERNPKVRQMLLDSRRASGLSCDTCDFARPALAPELQESLFEAHHLVPLSEAGEQKTKLSDLSLLCACCHRLIHRAMVLSGRWVGLEDARRMIVGDLAEAQFRSQD